MTTPSVIRTRQGASSAPLLRTIIGLALATCAVATVAACGSSGTPATSAPAAPPAATVSASAPAGGQGGDAEPYTGELPCDLLRGAGLGIHGVQTLPSKPDYSVRTCRVFTNSGEILVTVFYGDEFTSMATTPGVKLITAQPARMYDYNGLGRHGFIVRPAISTSKTMVIDAFLQQNNAPLLQRVLAAAFHGLTNPA